MDKEEEEDVEMMETDDYSPHKRKRNFGHSNASSAKVEDNHRSEHSSSKSRQIESRIVLKAKRKTNDKHIESYKSAKNAIQARNMSCILDTNVLLSHLRQLKECVVVEEKRRKRSANVGDCYSYVIPWIVLQELDHLKSVDKTNGVSSKFSDAMIAVRFINEQMRAKGVIRGEIQRESKSSKSNAKANQFVDEDINDDKIINCCLREKEHDNDYVILVTNDINLCNKALTLNIDALDWSEFYSRFEDNFVDSVSIKHKKISEEEPQQKRLKTSKEKACDNRVSHIRYSLTPNISFADVNSFHFSPNSNHHKSISNQKSSKSVPPKSKSPLKIDKNLMPSEAKRELIYYKCECEPKLMLFIEKKWREIWGEKDWTLMLELNRERATLSDMIRLIRKEWYNISDTFGSDSFAVKPLIDSLHESLKTSVKDSTANAVLSHLTQLMRYIEECPLMSRT